MTFSTLKVAWRNLGRNRRRTLLAIGAIGLGQLVVVSVNGMMAGFFQDFMATLTGPLVGHVQVHHPQWREEQAVDQTLNHVAETRAALAALPGVRAVSARILAPALVAPGERSVQPADAEAGMIVGLDPAIESKTDGILEGFAADSLPAGRGVVVGKILARRMNLRPGQTVAVIGQDADEFPVSELLEVKAVVETRVDLVNRFGVVMALPDAQALLALPDRAHELVVRGGDHRQAKALAAGIAALPLMGEAEILTWQEAAPELAQLVGIKHVMDLVFVGILFLAAAAGIANTMMMSTFERRRELGMLLALGTRPRRVVRLVLIEAVVLALLGVAVGSALGAAAVFITSQTGIDYAALAGTGTTADAMEFGYKGIRVSYVVYPRFEFRHVVFGMVAATVTAVLAALWPAVLAARLQPVEALRSS
jgi:ABC-type lipoprotein release transport system permease subunit